VGSGGTILHNVGQGWTPQTSGTTQDLDAIWGSGANDVYVGGQNGTLLHSVDHGQTWTPQDAGTPQAFFTIWGSGSEDVYACGIGCYHSTNRGQNWTLLPKLSFTVTALWGSGPNDLFAVGYGGGIAHTADHGQTWTAEQSGVTADLFAIWGSGPVDVYVAGDLGTMLRGH
jgi:photosystem II stability/assembly factor-like uncharacterized protein